MNEGIRGTWCNIQPPKALQSAWILQQVFQPVIPNAHMNLIPPQHYQEGLSQSTFNLKGPLRHQTPPMVVLLNHSNKQHLNSSLKVDIRASKWVSITSKRAADPYTMGG
jgi:hypothetical protein